MNVLEAIARRQSIRSYDPARVVDRETLGRILEAARLAPSAANRQPWELILVESRDALAKVHRCYRRSWFQDAPQVLAVAGFRERAWVRASDGFNALETDLAIAMDHLILAAEHEGVATCWISAFDPPALREALGLAEGEEVFAITPLGYPPAGFVRSVTKERKALAEIVRFV